MNEEKVRPEVVVDLLGKERTIKYTMRSLCQLKRLMGQSLTEGHDILDPEWFIATLWAGLIGGHKELDGPITKGVPCERVQEILDNLEREIDLTKRGLLTVKILEAFRNSGAQDAEEDNGEGKNE